MISYDEKIVEELGSILPTYYELICDSSTEKPCITYMPYNNYHNGLGNTLAFSHLEYMIKVWGEYKSDIEEYAGEVDLAMFKMGFKRVSMNELIIGRNIEKIMVYSIEDFETIEEDSNDDDSWNAD